MARLSDHKYSLMLANHSWLRRYVESRLLVFMFANVSSKITEEFVSEVAKKVVDARKQIVEGIAKGVAKVCKNHA